MTMIQPSRAIVLTLLIIATSLRAKREQLLRTAYLTAARSEASVTNHLAKQIVDAQGKTPAMAPMAPGK